MNLLMAGGAGAAAGGGSGAFPFPAAFTPTSLPGFTPHPGLHPANLEQMQKVAFLPSLTD